MLADQGLFFHADSLMGFFAVEWSMVAGLGDSLVTGQKLAVMLGNDGPPLINHYPLPVLQHFDVFADQGIRDGVAISVEMHISLNIDGPLLGEIDRRQDFW